MKHLVTRDLISKCHFLIGIVLIGIYSSTVYAQLCPDGDAAEAAVLGYMQGMKDYQFEAAYDHVTENMTDGKSREDWTELQLKFIVGGEVVIGKLDVRDAHSANAEDLACEKIAIVPNVLKAKDKFNNQGSTEFELYTVVNKEGTWKIDLQESLFDEKKIKHWFPDDEIPDFMNQL